MGRWISSRRTHLTGLGGLALALGTTAAPGAAAPPEPGADPAAVADWHATTVATVVTDAGKATAEAFLWYAFAQAAVYNAVVGITGRYALYKWDVRGPAGAAPEAAAAAAANRVLLTSFGHLPAARARLGDAYAAALGRVPDGAAKAQGVRYGERAADRMVALRVDDGRFAPVTFDTPLAPGVWRPTPAARAPFFAPWLARLRPLLLTPEGQTLDWSTYNADPRVHGAPRNPDGTVRADGPGWPLAFRPAGPPALTSAAYAADLNEVQALGGKTSARRTPAQTETGLFFSQVLIVPLQTALRDLVTERRLDISDSARLLAAADLSAADAVTSCWDAKLHCGFWRPVTAVRLAAEDGNPATEADPAWEPLIDTPPYPDYSSNLCSVFGAVARAVAGVLGTDAIGLPLASPATRTTRRYATAAGLCQDAVDARVWAGVHFRFADVDGMARGTQIGDWALAHYFRPLATPAGAT